MIDLEVGEIVCVTIQDHCDKSRTLVVAKVYGEVQEVTEQHVVIAYWTVDNSPDNTDCCCLIGSAIQTVAILREDVMQTKQLRPVRQPIHAVVGG